MKPFTLLKALMWSAIWGMGALFGSSGGFFDIHYFSITLSIGVFAGAMIMYATNGTYTKHNQEKTYD